MKITNLFSLLIIFFISCSTKDENHKESKESFKPALARLIRNMSDSLGEKYPKKLLSIEFCDLNRLEKPCLIKVSLSDCYSSAYIGGYTRFGKSAIVIYNLKDDVFECVNKNNITFFTDTIPGYKDCFSMPPSESESFYIIYNDSTIKRVYSKIEFPAIKVLRRSRCAAPIIFSIPEKEYFFHDSIQAEKDLEYYKKEVEYYRHQK